MSNEYGFNNGKVFFLYIFIGVNDLISMGISVSKEYIYLSKNTADGIYVTLKFLRYVIDNMGE